MEKGRRRMTEQRRAVLEELRRAGTHPTAEEVHGLVRRRIPRVSLGTVYRNLEDLASEGSVTKLAIAAGRSRFDGNVSRHYHIRCVRCERVEDVQVRIPSGIESAVSGKSDFRVLGHRLEFDGICPKCRRKR